jgi:hypothetical protein
MVMSALDDARSSVRFFIETCFFFGFIYVVVVIFDFYGSGESCAWVGRLRSADDRFDRFEADR